MTDKSALLPTCALMQAGRTNNATSFQGGCFATSKDTCFVANNDGKIYRTTDGGVAWDSVQTLFAYSWFNDIKFPSKDIGYACGGTNFGSYTSCIAKTINGGATWDSLTSNSFGYEFRNMYIVNDTIGFFAGDSLVRTMDGGQTFSTIPLPFSTMQVIPLINTVYFFDSNNGLIATREYVSSSKTRHRIAHTTDGGINWTTTHLDSSISWGTSKNINAIDFRNQFNGYAVGANGTFLSTSDGGLNWVASSSLPNDTSYLTDIVLSKNSLTGYIVGQKYNGEGCIYKTTDGGFSWQTNFIAPIGDIYSISMATDDTVYAAGNTNIFKTINGGVGINENPKKENEIIIYPNPFSSSTTLRTDNLFKNATLTVYNSFGQTVKQIDNLAGQTIIFHRDNLPSGLYFLRMTQDSKIITADKLVISD